MIVNKKEIAEVFGVSTTQIENYMKNGMPYEPAEKRGKSNKYDTAKCIEWFVYSKGKKLDYQEERTMLTKLQADRQNLEVQILQGELLKADEVLLEWSNIFSQIKSSLLAIPTRAAAMLVGVEKKTETKKIIENLLRETLEKIANNTTNNNKKHNRKGNSKH